MSEFTIYVQNKGPYMVIGFDRVIHPKREPITLADEEILPGDKITAIIGKMSSAGFGSFDLKRGFIAYAGKITISEDGKDYDYALFEYDFQKDLFGEINGHKSAYVCWGFSDVDGKTLLFYQNKSLSSRVIVPDKIRRYVDTAA